ncbi:MAG: hypothetical protein OEZ06_04210 [Myxococcales bacterium]|nr:hypothetical protein [Myxococcales bacterium]
MQLWAMRLRWITLLVLVLVACEDDPEDLDYLHEAGTPVQDGGPEPDASADQDIDQDTDQDTDQDAGAP